MNKIFTVLIYLLISSTLSAQTEKIDEILKKNISDNEKRALLAKSEIRKNIFYDTANKQSKAKIVERYSDLPSRTVLNAYDKIYRLKTETFSTSDALSQSTQYVYNNANNRISKIDSTGTTTYTYGSEANGYNSNQLVSAGNRTFTYDDNGNRLTDTKNDGYYVYDYDNRLITFGNSSGFYNYAYDHRTRRVLRDESLAGGKLTSLSFADGLSVQEYEDGSNTPSVEYIRGSDYGGGIGGILYTIRGGVPKFNHYNSRGDVVSQTAQDGTVAYQASYEAFGTRTAEEGDTQDRQKANTKDEDPTGLLNEGMRYRCLETGVFITRDPAGFVDGPNVYTYVNQNPWSAFDADGLFLGFVADIGFAAWDTVAVARGSISKTEYAKRMTLTGASFVANLGSAGTAGLAVRSVSIASRAAKAANIAVKTAKAVDKTNNAYQTVNAVAQNGQAATQALNEGDARGVLKAVAATALEASGGKKTSKSLGIGGNSAKKTKIQTKSPAPNSERVRHFTNSKGADGIKDSNTIKASDQNSVFTEKAKGKPGSPRDVEEKLGIKRGRGNNMVEFDADPSEFSVIKNPTTGATERVFKGDVDLTGRNPTFKKNR